MTGAERVRNTILGKPIDRQPIYGWVEWNMKEPLIREYGSAAAFEDHFEFDAAHIFGGPGPFKKEVMDRLAAENDEVTPDLLVEEDFLTDPDNLDDYRNLVESMAFHKEKGRFCYVQTPGFFENFNGAFGIENHLMYLMLDEEEIAQLYARQAEWTIRFAGHCIDLGADMIHISDDWGAQNNMMFSPELWWKLVYPNMKKVVDYVHSRGVFVSLHSDGCVMNVADGIAGLGIDVVHPWQENAGMSYDVYLEKYQDKFAILGGICVQSVLGLLPQDKLEAEIRRVFGKLRGKRWIVCTTHFVQEHCRIEDLTFAYELIYKLARE